MSEAERTAFEDLYREHYWTLLRFAMRRSTDPDRARDLVAETFATAWRRRSTLPAARSLPWLYKIAGNLLANERRRDERAAKAYRTLDGYSSTEHQAGTAEQTEWSEALRDVLRALQELSDDDQQVLMLHAWEGLHGRDLGTALGCSAAAASVRLHRARRRLDAAINVRNAGIVRQPAAEASAPIGTKGEHS
jgi:RNA polymerase sigma-70 factor (ECF subfamily)